MIKRDYVIDILAPLHKVFAFVTDLNNFVTWQGGVSEASQSPQGPTRLGTTVRLAFAFLGTRLETAGVVTEFVQDKRCAFKTTSGPIRLDVLQTCTAIPGGTRLTLHLEAEPGGLLKLAEPAIERQLDAAFESQAQELKSILEA